MSKPILGVLIGFVAGLVIGVLLVLEFAVEALLSQFCIVASSVMVMQLLGSTIAATLGKPHHPD